MKKIIYLIFLTGFYQLFAQVGIGNTSPDESSILDITSNNSGILIPRLTELERLAIVTPATGLLVYQTNSTNGFWYYTGSSWVNFASDGWALTGNIGTNPTNNFLGTTDSQDLTFITNNLERLRVKNNGHIGVNENNPTHGLHITGSAPVLTIEDGNEGANNILTSDKYGNAKWRTASSVAIVDNDWNFYSGTTSADDAYHIGGVRIGTPGDVERPFYQLSIKGPNNNNTFLGIGDVESIRDGGAAFQFSHRLVPEQDNLEPLGKVSSTITRRWTEIIAANGTIQTSDGNDKTDVETIQYGLESVLKLKPVMYNWKDERYGDFIVPENEKELKLGLIAQDVLEVVPEVVKEYIWRPKSEEELDIYIKEKCQYLGINYEELTAVLIKAKQEQQIILNQLKLETEQLLIELKSIKNN